MATLYYGCTLNYVYTFTMALLTTLQAAAATLRLPDPAPCSSDLERLLRSWQCDNETATDLQGLGLIPDPTPELLPGPDPKPNPNQATDLQGVTHSKYRMQRVPSTRVSMIMLDLTLILTLILTP